MAKNIFSIVAKKGGVGKTTIAINMAQVLALSGVSVLLIDNDEQHNLTSALGILDYNTDISDLYSGAVMPQEFVEKGIYSTGIKNLYCVPCSSNISNIKFKSKTVLKEMLELIDVGFVFIDCAPGAGLIQNEIALQSSDNFIIPVNCKQFAVNGCIEMVNHLVSIMGKSMNDIIIILNNVKKTAYGKIKTKKQTEFINVLMQLHEELIPKTTISTDEEIDNSTIDSSSMFMTRLKTAPSAKEFILLVCEIFGIDFRELYNDILAARKEYKSKKAKAFFKTYEAQK